MREVVLGIDIGTSYTKAAMRSATGQILRVSRTRSPILHDPANIKTYEWWECIRAVLRDILTAQWRQESHRICGICISGIAPTLTVFDRADCRRAYSILYSSLPSDGRSWSQCDRHLTLFRIRTLEKIAACAGFVSPAVTDLVGYINWCLTNELTINTISLVEMGMTSGREDCKALAVGGFESPTLVRVTETIGKTGTSISAELGLPCGIPVCGGCSDTVASVVGAGLCKASDTMLYLGTFGSFMCLEVDVNNLLETTSCSALPFSWMLSVPGFGPQIESLSKECLHFDSSESQLNRFDSFAAETSPGAEGTLFLVPRWKNGMTTVGTFAFIPGKDGNIGEIGRRARAVLESLGYAIFSLVDQKLNIIKASGGGARSTTWLDSVSAALGIDIEAQAMCWEAAGTADIAARMIWDEAAARECYRATGSMKTSAIIHENCARARKLYRSEGWI